jgi:cytidylate kinase
MVAADAVIVDTTHITAEAAAQRVLEVVRDKLGSG